MLLTFDTCLDKTYIGLADKKTNFKDTIIVENEGNKYHSAFLISNIRDILKKHNLTPNDITTIATDIGPGSFTGIRACMTVAKVMAQQLNIKITGVSSLEILSKIKKTENTPLVLLDARKNKVYVWEKQILGAIPTEEVQEKVKAGKYSLITDDSMFEIFSPITDDIVSYTQINPNLAEILTDISFKKEAVNWEDLTPLYIQPPPVFGK